MERFDPAVRIWESLPPMLTRRSRHASAVIAGTQDLSSMERFDPMEGAWEALLHVCRSSDAPFDPRHEDHMRDFHNPLAGRWEALPRMSARRSQLIAAVITGQLSAARLTYRRE